MKMIKIYRINFAEKMRKSLTFFLLKCWGQSGAKACKSCRSRQELFNEYLLAKTGFDTAENEPFNFHNFSSSIQGFNFHSAVVSGLARWAARSTETTHSGAQSQTTTTTCTEKVRKVWAAVRLSFGWSSYRFIYFPDDSVTSLRNLKVT